jgi:hypothetical protein
MEYLGLYNKPKAEVHPGHKLTGPKEEDGEEEAGLSVKSKLLNMLGLQCTESTTAKWVYDS